MRSRRRQVIQQQSQEFDLIEYESVRAEIESLLADVNKNYQWVLASTAVILGTQLFGSTFDEVSKSLIKSPWLLLLFALGLLWFPAYDASRWADINAAVKYLSTCLVPRLERRGWDHNGPTWGAFRNSWQVERRKWLMSLWAAKFALPYLPTLIAFFAYIVAKGASGQSIDWWERIGLAVWLAVGISLGFAVWKTAVATPKPSSH